MPPEPTKTPTAPAAATEPSRARVAEALQASVAEALEVMAFVIAEPAAAPAEPPAADAPGGGADLLLTSVPIDGTAAAAALDFVCPAAFGGLLEANVGLEDAPSDGVGAAGLRELGNVVCGLLIRRLRDAGTPDAMIGLPAQRAFAAADWAAFAGAAGAAVMDADGVRLAARVRPPAAAAKEAA